MNYYALYMFEKSKACDSAYLLKESKGKASGVIFPKYAETEENIRKGIAGKEYVRFCVPRTETMKKYFEHTFEFGQGCILTSTEKLDEDNCTFGDSKRIGTCDLIIVQFSKDMNRLCMWFIKDKGFSKVMKQKEFSSWKNGSKLTYNAIQN